MSENSALKWYIVNTYSGHENRARLTLLERIKNATLDNEFGEVLIPTENVLEVVKGQRRTSTRKFFPGYMFVQMNLNERTLHLVKNTPKITGFLGGANPTPVPERDITGIHSQMEEGRTKPKAKASFSIGDSVRIVDGPFKDVSTKVEKVNADKEKVTVLVPMLGRPTPVDIEFAKILKA